MKRRESRITDKFLPGLDRVGTEGEGGELAGDGDDEEEWEGFHLGRSIGQRESNIEHFALGGIKIGLCNLGDRGFCFGMKKSWQELIREGAQSTPVDPREVFMGALEQAFRDLEPAFVAEGRVIRIEKGDKPGLGSVVVENKLRKELVLTLNVSERAVAFRVFNTRLESYDCQGGSPEGYDAGTLRNVVAYFYNIAVKGEKAPGKLNAGDFGEE